MADVFISYSRTDRDLVAQIAAMIEAEGYAVWWDADLPPHKSYGDVITEQIVAARAALVVWSHSAAASEWVRAEADMARSQRKLIQTAVDDVMPPLPFNQIQYAPLGDWRGEPDHPGWRKVRASLDELCGPRSADPPAQPVPAFAVAPPVAPPVRSRHADGLRAGGTGPGNTGPGNTGPGKWPLFAGIAIAAIALVAAGILVLSSSGGGTDQPAEPAPTASASIAAVGDAQTSPASAASSEPTPEQAPTPAPTPTPAETVQVTAPAADATAAAPQPRIAERDWAIATVEDADGYANVRRGPSVATEVVGQVRVGERMAAQRSDGNWWRVRLADGTRGYIARSRIRLLRDGELRGGE